MAGKRQATSDLNHNNWDQEEEPEERGTFRTATEDELKNRVIKKGKRKIASVSSSDAGDENSASKSVFSAFSGLGKQTTSSAAPFSFLSKIPAVASATSSVVSSSTTTVSNLPFSFSSTPSVSTTTANSTENPKTSFSCGNTVVNVTTSAAKTSIDAKNENVDYYRNLSSLNMAVSEWIKSHVDKNPICILSPIFKDYEKYLTEIETERKKQTPTLKSSDVVDKPPVTSAANFQFPIGSSSSNKVSTHTTGPTSTTSESTAKINGFSFGLKTPENTSLIKPATGASFGLNSSIVTSTVAASTSTPTFSFGNISSNTKQSSAAPKPFCFSSSSTPFSFGNIKPPDAVVSDTTAKGNDPNEEDEEPPKNEFKQVVEEDAVYSKKCKVFVKKDGNFVDKGVGTLYLKPIESSGKTQLLVRADTNLGNIIVNLILNSAIPAQRMGKNNVMMVCLPTPEDEKPTSLLLRVKSGEEADELLGNIEKYKK